MEKEISLKNLGIRYTFLRPPAFMKNVITQFGQTIKTQNAFYVHAGDAKMSFVDVSDIAAIAANMLMNSNGGKNKQYMNKAYDITGPESINI